MLATRTWLVLGAKSTMTVSLASNTPRVGGTSRLEGIRDGVYRAYLPACRPGTPIAAIVFGANRGRTAGVFLPLADGFCPLLDGRPASG